MFALKVNGVSYDHIVVRHQMLDGYPGGPFEAVVDDPILGDMVITPQCSIEIQAEEQSSFTGISLQGLIDLVGSPQKFS